MASGGGRNWKDLEPEHQRIGKEPSASAKSPKMGVGT